VIFGLTCVALSRFFAVQGADSDAQTARDAPI
jgi:hypothetical protein